MTSLSLEKTHRQMTSSVAWHHCHWTSHRVKRHGVWHAIIAFGKHTRSNDIRRGMPSSPLGSTDGRTVSGVACYHRLWVAHIVERRRAWLAIIAFGMHTQSNDVGHGMASPPLDSTHGQKHQAWHNIAAFRHHTQLDDVGRGMPSSPLGSTHDRMTLSVA